MTTPTYCYSTDEEDCFVGDYATREEALTVGIDAARDEGHASVFTARCGATARASDYVSDRAAEWLIDAVRDDAGDAAEHTVAGEWLDKVTQSQCDDLAVRIGAALDAWCRSHGHEPRYWHVEDVQEHAVTNDTARLEGEAGR